MAADKKHNRIAAAQQGLDYSACYAAAQKASGHKAVPPPTRTGARGTAPPPAKATGKVRARGGLAAAVLRGPFLAPGSLTLRERLRTLDGLERVIEGAYAHLPLKRARYGFDPVQRLRILRAQVMADTTLSEEVFHVELADILTRLRDAHTRYSGPASLEDVTAVLPFFVEMIGSRQQPQYVVSKVTEDLGPRFVAGVVVESWSGVPIDLAVQRWADHEVGGRPDTQRANAVLSLTMRSLQFGAPPDEHWVIVGYREVDARGRPHGPQLEVRVPWRIVIPRKAAARAARAQARARSPVQALRQSVNPAAAAMRRAKMLMFAPQVLAAKAKPVTARAKASPVSLMPETLRVTLPPKSPVPVLRIWAFDVEPGPFLAELRRLLPLLPQDGLVIDVRGNPGGYIEAAEGALQLFTPGRITPTRFSVLATPLTRALSGGVPGVKAWARAELGPWRESLDAAVRSGEPYSRPLPLTSDDDCNAFGQLYGGPVVLVADATTYSSGDLFSAGFVDHRIGPFVCVGDATGAGGANVWNYRDLFDALARTKPPLPRLADGIGLSLSMRRATRSLGSQGLQIEDVGVGLLPGDTPYAMSRADLLEGNRDLLAHCAKLLAKMPVTGLRAERLPRRRLVRVSTLGLARVDVRVDDVPQPSFVPQPGKSADLPYPAGAKRMELVGVAGGRVVQRRLLPLRD
jgi:C-terminal processing protease CtpA/Prc